MVGGIVAFVGNGPVDATPRHVVGVRLASMPRNHSYVCESDSTRAVRCAPTHNADCVQTNNSIDHHSVWCQPHAVLQRHEARIGSSRAAVLSYRVAWMSGGVFEWMATHLTVMLNAGQI